jgi:hypothetical protein
MSTKVDNANFYGPYQVNDEWEKLCNQPKILIGNGKENHWPNCRHPHRRKAFVQDSAVLYFSTS